jgi:hypothetical protein
MGRGPDRSKKKPATPSQYRLAILARRVSETQPRGKIVRVVVEIVLPVVAHAD